MLSTDATTICAQWISARRQLSQALCSYEATCNSLCALGLQIGAALECVQPDFLLSIEADLPLLPQEAERIIRPLSSLKKLRNCSVKLVPINRLPSELLASIFSIAICTSQAERPHKDYARHKKVLLNVISSVSSSWRQVTLATPTLWVDITLDRAESVNHATLWLERSRVSPIHLRSLDYHHRSSDQGLAELVGQHSGRFRSLILRVDRALGQQVFYDACVQHTDASVKLELLAVTGEISALEGKPRDMNWPPKDQMDRYLVSVRRLYVKFRSFDDWSSAVFNNLTTLSLCWIEHQVAPTYQELLDMLRASPRLRILELSMFTAAAIPQRHTAPVHLENLQTLWLEGFRFQFVKWLLESIIPQQDGLTLALDDIAYAGYQSIGFELPFSIPDTVRDLYIRSSHQTSFPIDLSGLLESSKHLETLALQCVELEITELIGHPHSGEHPVLAALDLKSCYVTNAARFKAMLARHSVRQLRIFDCEGCPVADEIAELLPGIVVNEEPGDFLTMFSPFD